MGDDDTTAQCLDGAGGVDDTSLLFDDNLMTISTTTRVLFIHPSTPSSMLGIEPPSEDTIQKLKDM